MFEIATIYSTFVNIDLYSCCLFPCIPSNIRCSHYSYNIRSLLSSPQQYICLSVLYLLIFLNVFFYLFTLSIGILLYALLIETEYWKNVKLLFIKHKKL